MSSVHVYFGSRLLNLNNLSREEAEGMAVNLGEGNPGVTTIHMQDGTRYIVNRSNIDYVEVRLRDD